MTNLTAQQKAMMEMEAVKEAIWAKSSGIDMKRIENQGEAMRRAPQRIGAKAKRLQDTHSRGLRRRTADAMRRGYLAA